MQSASNIPDGIKAKIGRNLHRKEGHPLNIIKQRIFAYFDSLPEFKFAKFDDLDPQVSVKDNFDVLRTPKDHPSRKRTDTYYVDQDTVLRTHTTAHQVALLSKGVTTFLVAGDVYRKDEVDKHHYPVFHQLEGAHLVAEGVSAEDAEKQLKEVLSGLMKHLFPACEYEFKKDYFPFTDPSYEVNVKFHDKWIEVLGCGLIHPEIMTSIGFDGNTKPQRRGWAFGLGLERLALVLFDIPDIRLFWTDDPRFHDQFKDKDAITKDIKFKPYPKLQAIAKDVSLWIPQDEIVPAITAPKEGEGKQEEPHKFEWKNVNNLYELVREVCKDAIERVEVMDAFLHPKHKKYSMTFRLHLTPSEAERESMTDPAKLTLTANILLAEVAAKIKAMGYTLR